MPGTSAEIKVSDADLYSSVYVDGKNSKNLHTGKFEKTKFPGSKLLNDPHRKISGTFDTISPDSVNWQALYEATIFSADNNALEVRSLHRSGSTKIPQVQKARDAFFNQRVFIERGIWDRNLFDGDMETAFWPLSGKYRRDQRVNGGCLRLDLGELVPIDQLVLRIPDEYSLQPLLNDEGNYVEVSNDLTHWQSIIFLASKTIHFDLDQPYRYYRFSSYPDRIAEIEGYYKGKSLNRDKWRVTNLFSIVDNRFKCQLVWKTSFILDEIIDNSYLSIAVNGKHGIEGAYAACMIDGKFVGAPDRAPSYPSNTWENINCRSDQNYTYYIPLKSEYINKPIEVYIMGFDRDNLDLEPEVWISANPIPYEKVNLVLYKKIDQENSNFIQKN